MANIGLPTVDLLQAIRRIVREDRLRNETNVTTRAKRRIARGDAGGTNVTMRFGRTTSAITGATGTTTRTLGSGTVDLFENTGTAGTNTTDNVTAYNTMTATIDTDTYVQLTHFAPSGDWFITAVDCG